MFGHRRIHGNIVMAQLISHVFNKPDLSEEKEVDDSSVNRMAAYYVYK